MKIIRYTAWLAHLLLIAGCSEPTKLERDTLPRVKVAQAGEKVSDKLFFPAVANAAERSHLSFRVAGEISKFHVKEALVLSKATSWLKLSRPITVWLSIMLKHYFP